MARCILKKQKRKQQGHWTTKVAVVIAWGVGISFGVSTVQGQAVFRSPVLGPQKTIEDHGARNKSPFRSISAYQETENANGLQAITRSGANRQSTPFSNLSPEQADLLKPRFETVTEGSYSGAEPYSGPYTQPYSGGLSYPGGAVQLQQPENPRLSPDGDSGFGQLEVMPPELTNVPQTANENGLEEILQYYPDGKIRIRRFVAKDEKGNYVKEGPWIYYDKSERVIAAGRYRNGIMHGQWQRIHTQAEGGLFVTKPFTLFPGAFQSIANFNRGKLNGVWTITDQYRRKIFEMSYKNGVRHGLATWWYPNGMKMKQANFDNGILDGNVTDWDENQKVLGTQSYVNGRKLVRNTSYYRPKVPQSEEQFLEAKLEPSGEDNWWDAKPTPYLPVGSRIQDGPAMEWFANGQRKKRGAFKDDLELGTFTWWHENGNKRIEGRYVKGEKQGVWTWWHSNGMKHIEGTYDNNRPAGVWRSWGADGTLQKEENFSLESVPADNDQEETGTGEASTDSTEAGESVIGLEDPKPEVLPKPDDTPPESIDSGASSDDPLAETEEILPIEFEDTSGLKSSETENAGTSEPENRSTPEEEASGS